MSKFVAFLCAVIFVCCLVLGAFEIYSWGYENGTINALEHASELMLAANGGKVTCVQIDNFVDSIVDFWNRIGRW